MELRNIRGLTGADVTVYDITGCLPGQHLGLPSPSATLVIDLADGLVLGTQSRPTPEIFRCCLAGMHLRPVTIHHDGTQRGVQLDLDPRTVRTLFGVPVAELANDSVELSQVDHAVADELYHRLADAAPSARARVAADVLARAADPADAPVDAYE
ncbi:MAG: AraC family transcriptional regulator, partial [Gordonia sp. (in: high G+C Gram-positive bacteria)]